MMYNTPKDKMPSRPVVVSQVSADQIVKEWTRENDLSLISDSSGQNWQLKVELHIEPSKDDVKASVYELQLQLWTHVDARELVHSGVLSEDKDKRLLDLLGSNVISIYLKPRFITDKSLEEVRYKFIDEVGRLKKELKSSDLAPVKRSMVGKWVDQQGLFQRRP